MGGPLNVISSLAPYSPWSSACCPQDPAEFRSVVQVRRRLRVLRRPPARLSPDLGVGVAWLELRPLHPARLPLAPSRLKQGRLCRRLGLPLSTLVLPAVGGAGQPAVGAPATRLVPVVGPVLTSATLCPIQLVPSLDIGRMGTAAVNAAATPVAVAVQPAVLERCRQPGYSRPPGPRGRIFCRNTAGSGSVVTPQ